MRPELTLTWAGSLQVNSNLNKTLTNTVSLQLQGVSLFSGIGWSIHLSDIAWLVFP